ncbi:hypothetical protein [Roseibium sp.]|uniref:hypothetical protein n=1 Tax=Roseibium sp. TaxID=1936156 RepID=UPI003D0CE40C
MTEIAISGPARLPLGIGSIIGDTFSIFFRRFLAVTFIALIPNVIGILLSAWSVGLSAVVGMEKPDFSGIDTIPYTISMIVDVAVYAVATALLVQLAYDAKLQRPVRLGRYFGPAFSTALPVIVLSVAAMLLSILALVFLVVPGLWVMAVFSVTVPAVVIERVGFRGLGRSAELTKEYRWPIVVLALLSLLCQFAFGWGAQYLAAILGTVSGMLPAAVFYAVVAAVGTGLTGLPAALIYARLREIKEGVTVDQIAAVFD